MPYFSNKTNDPAVDGYARTGGQLFAQTLETLYGLVAELEVDVVQNVPGRLGRMGELLGESIRAYQAAADVASPEPTDLTDTPAFGEPELVPLVDAAERLGMSVRAFSDRDIYIATVEFLMPIRDLVDEARESRNVDFLAIREIIRAATRAQEVSLAATGVMTGLYRGDYA
ncbi:hypothetical protein [Emcibacter sp. SYSU 3D8]|uniref:hypothetical protein n=1 Tax=Emcibacter sp. SYSU 3D8 TaxID=3133969 RepID=UPI0031FE8D07